jgi:hypothetical protein
MPDHSLKIFAKPARYPLEIAMWPDYDHPRASSARRADLTACGWPEFLAGEVS